MDPEYINMPSYFYIPLLNPSEIENLMKSQRNIAFYHNLILDLTDFDHPGSNQILKEHFNTDITSLYTKYDHSFTANIMICQKVIGRKYDLSLQKVTIQFYESVLNSKTFLQQQYILSKMNFNRPLRHSLYSLSLEQITALTEIPKYFKNPQKILIENYNEVKNQIPESVQCALVYALVICLLFIFQLFKSGLELYDSSFIIIGFLFGSFLEYLLHRYDYHRDIIKNYSFSGADIHHCFPNIQYYMPARIQNITRQIFLVIFILAFILSLSQITYFMIGIFTLLFCHNLSHHLTHTTNEINIKWIKNLKLNHQRHHFKNQHAYYGISMTLWDYVFRTRV